MFMLNLLDNLPRLRLSDDHLKAIIWVMKECGTPDVPSFYARRKMQKKSTQDVGLQPRHHTSSLDNQFYMNHPNDLIRLVRSAHCCIQIINLNMAGFFKPACPRTLEFLSRSHDIGNGILASRKMGVRARGRRLEPNVGKLDWSVAPALLHQRTCTM
jgi:hypothetical protein